MKFCRIRFVFLSGFVFFTREGTSSSQVQLFDVLSFTSSFSGDLNTISPHPFFAMVKGKNVVNTNETHAMYMQHNK